MTSMIDRHYAAMLAAHVHGRNFLRPADERVRQLVGNVERAQALYYVTVGSIFSVAQATMTDALALLRASPHWRHDVKRHARKAMRQYDAWERLMRSALGKDGRYQIWLDLSDDVYEQVRPDLWHLWQLIQDALLRLGEPEAELKAALVWSESVAGVAARALDNFLVTVREGTGVDIAQLYSTAASFDPIYRSWRLACDPILRTANATDGDICMSDLPECREAMAALQAKLYDVATYNRAGAEAVRLNLPGAEPADMGTESDPFVQGIYNGMRAGHEEQQDQTKQTKQPQQTTTAMRGTYYEARVRYIRPDNNTKKRVTEKFIVEADTMTEVEAVVTARLTIVEGSATPQLLACAATKTVEVWDLTGTPADITVFKATIDYVELKDNGKERRISAQYIIRADDIDAAGKEAARRIRAFGHGYELRSLQNVRVADIFEREDTGK